MFFITDKFPETEGILFFAYSNNKQKLQKLINDSSEEMINYDLNPNVLQIKEFNVYFILEVPFDKNIINTKNLENISINTDFKLTIGNKSFLFKIIDNEDNKKYRSFHIHLNNDKSVEYLVSLDLSLFKYINEYTSCGNCEYCRCKNFGISNEVKKNKFYFEGLLNE